MSEEKKDAKFFVYKFWPKLIERLTVAKVAMENGMDISDKDLSLIKAQHKLYYNGEVEFDDSLSSVDSAISTTQGELFNNVVMSECDGTGVVKNDA